MCLCAMTIEVTFPNFRAEWTDADESRRQVSRSELRLKADEIYHSLANVKMGGSAEIQCNTLQHAAAHYSTLRHCQLYLNMYMCMYIHIC